MKRRRRAATPAQRPSQLLSFAALAVILLMLGACGEDDAVGNGGTSPTATPTTAPSPTPEPIEHPTGDGEYILYVAWEGGFVTPEMLITRPPLFTLTGDGCLVVEGPQIEIYPQPILPNLQETCLTEEGVQAILRAAKDAGLLDGDAEYGYDMIADAPWTVFTVNANGTTTTVRAYALQEGTETGDAEADAAREKLVELQKKLGDLRSWLPASAFDGDEHPYDVTRMQVVSRPAGADDGMATPEGIEIQTLDWPLSTPLAELGEPYTSFEDWRCTVIEGDDLVTLMAQLREANQLTQWTSDGEPYNLLIRPLLPGEEGCVPTL